jgi:pilus assembly protein CpaF
VSRTDALASVRRGLHEQLLQRVDARGLETVSRAERRLRVREEALAILRSEGHILPQSTLARVINEVSDAVVGLGPIEFLLKDPDITEVMVNGPDDVYVERKGRIVKVDDRLFEGEEAVLHVIERIVAPAGPSGRCCVTLGGCATVRWQQGARDRSAPFALRPGGDDPQVHAAPVHTG